MEIEKAKNLAIELMTKYGLRGNRHFWGFNIVRGKNRYGYCQTRKKTINISKDFIEYAPDDEIKDLILHEIAHALVTVRYQKDNGHGLTWKMICLEIGARPERCLEKEIVPCKYLIQCPLCGFVGGRNRKHIEGATYRCNKCKSPTTLIENIEKKICQSG